MIADRIRFENVKVLRESPALPAEFAEITLSILRASAVKEAHG
jgi:hypothetical protein